MSSNVMQQQLSDISQNYATNRNNYIELGFNFIHSNIFSLAVGLKAPEYEKLANAVHLPDRDITFPEVQTLNISQLQNIAKLSTQRLTEEEPKNLCAIKHSYVAMAVLSVASAANQIANFDANPASQQDKLQQINSIVASAAENAKLGSKIAATDIKTLELKGTSLGYTQELLSNTQAAINKAVKSLEALNKQVANTMQNSQPNGQLLANSVTTQASTEKQRQKISI